MSDTSMYVGKIREVRSSYGTYHYALVEPLLKSDVDATEWVGTVSDVLQDFPTRGRVYWHSASPSLLRGSIWQFSIEPKPSGAHAEPGHDAWQVVDPRQPIEIIDVQAWDEDELRVALTGSGLPIHPMPLVRRVAFWIDPDHLLGPLKIALAEDQRSWVLESDDLAKLPVWRTQFDSICPVNLDGPRFLLEPSLDLGSSAGIRDWSADEVVAKQLIQRIRQHNKLTAEALNVTESVFANYVEVLRKTGFLGKDGALDRVRVGRIAALRRTIERDRELIEQASTALLHTPAVSGRVERLVEEAVVTELARRSNEIEQSTADLTKARETLASHIAQLGERRSELEAAIIDRERRLAESDEVLERRLSDENALLLARRAQVEGSVVDLENRLASLEVDLRTRAADFEQEFAERLQELATSPARALADLAFARALLESKSDSGTSGRNGADRNSRRAPALAGLPEDQPIVTRFKQLQSVLLVHASNRGADFERALELHAACLAGAFPLVHGDGTEDLLESYAATIAGGRILWVPVGASAIEPGRLLGGLDVATRRFVPEANGLAELLIEADQSPDVHVVVFEGVNRAPVDGWLFPLLNAMEAERRGRTDRGIPLVPRGTLEPSDPFADVERLRWPVNVIPIGTTTHGTSTLPLPPDIWRFGALIVTDGAPRPGPRPDPVPPSRVEAAKWTEWVRQVVNADAPELVAAQQVLDKLPTGTRHLDVAARMLCALRCHEMEEATARPHALIPTLVPRFVEGEEVLHQSGTAIGVGSSENWSRALEVARQLSE